MEYSDAEELKLMLFRHFNKYNKLIHIIIVKLK